MTDTRRFILAGFILLLWCCVGLQERAYALDDDQINILVLSSFPRDIPAQVSLEEGLKKSLPVTKRSSNLFFEFMDVPRLGSYGAPEVLAGHLATKYANVKLDFIVGWASDAINFIHNQPTLFPEAQKIYLEARDEHRLNLRDNERVIAPNNDFRSSLKDTLLLESPRHIVVIGTTRDRSARSRLAMFKQLLADLAPTVKTEYLLDQDLESVAARLAALPRDRTLAFYLLMFSDGRGVPMSPYAVVSRLAARSAVPIFSFWESLMGSGIAGGYLVSQAKAGEQLGEMMLALHHGSAVGELNPMRRSYDWLALKKWGISQSKIPAGAHLINRKVSLLEEYFWYIAGTIAFCGIEFLLIMYLMINRFRRKKVEEELRVYQTELEDLVDERTNELRATNRSLLASEERFKTLSDAAFEGILLLENGIIFDANKTLLNMLGYEADEVVGRQSTDFVDQACSDEVEEIIRSEQTGPYETKLVGKDGVSFPVMIHARMFSIMDRRIRVVAIRDLTKQKEAEEEIRTLRGILPICSVCKKIRDDQGYWKRIEEYIESRSEALFSHGLCSSCEQELYGDQKWFQKRQRNKQE